MRNHVIDVTQLRIMTGDDAQLACEVFSIFRQQVDMWSKLLDPRGDISQWTDAAHTIKGAARSIGATKLGEICEEAEVKGRTNDVSIAEASVLINDVKDQLAEALDAIAEMEHQLLMSKSFNES